MSLLCRLGLHSKRVILIVGTKALETRAALLIIYCQREGCRYGPDRPARVEVIDLPNKEEKDGRV